MTPAPVPVALTGTRLLGVMGVLTLLSMLGPFSIDTAFPAFSQMGEDFSVDAAQMQYVVSAYLLAFGLMSPFHGPLSDAVGRRPVILGGVALYVLASIGAAASTSLEMLLVFRVLQGLSAGGGVIVGRTIIRDLFEGAAAQRLMSQVMMVFSIAPAVAPIIGGILLQWGPWPVVFWFMAGVGVLIVVLVWQLLPETHPVQDRQPLNVAGLVGSLGGVAHSGRFHRVAWAAGLTFGGLFLYIGAAPIIVVDILGRGELDFWMLFVPLISGIVLGSFLSSRAAGRVTGRRLVNLAMVAAMGAAGVNVLLSALPATQELPWVMLGPALIAISTSVAYPTLQLALLDMFPDHRGATVSMFTFLTLSLNGLVAALVAPYVVDSMLQVAATSAAMVAVGVACWVWHVRVTPVAGNAQAPGPGGIHRG